MSEAEVKQKEEVKQKVNLEVLLRNFKRQCARSGVMAELRKREFYEKPGRKRRRKKQEAAAAAKKRKSSKKQ